jgi:hypothetical protein
MKKRNTIFSPVSLIGLSSLLILGGCGGSSSSSSSSDSMNATTYEFFDTDGNSTVYYDGQTARQVLISKVKSDIGSLTRDPGANEQTIIDNINFYILESSVSSRETLGGSYAYTDKTVGGLYNSALANPNRSDLNITDSNGINADQVSTGDNLEAKMAGNDPSTSVDNNPNGLLGDGTFYTGALQALQSEPGFDISTPAKMIQSLIIGLADSVTESPAPTINTVSVIGGSVTTGVAIPAFVDGDGLDQQQVIQKLLTGMVTFHQGTADYLQTNFASKIFSGTPAGLDMVHKFDEGWGYFGGARNYGTLELPAIKAGFNDDNPMDAIFDISSELNIGNSINCAKRDLGGDQTTDFVGEVWSAFISAREILQDAMNEGELTALQQSELDDQIEIASQTWEKCIAATVVHYINDITKDTGDMANFDVTQNAYVVDGDSNSYETVAKHWGEMWGFAMGLQFSPHSPFRTGSVTDGLNVNVITNTHDMNIYQQVLVLMGTGPVLADAGLTAITAYKNDLLAARDILKDAYGFTASQAENW